MMSGQGYKRFENPEDDVPVPPNNKTTTRTSTNQVRSITSTESFSGPVIVVDGRRAPSSSAINFVQPLPEESADRRKRYLRAWKFLRALAAVGLLLACSIVVVEAFEDVFIARDDDADNFGVCGLGTGVWAGALGVAAGVLGVCAFRVIDSSGVSNRALLISYFVLAIVASVGDGVLIIITSFCLDSLPYVRSGHYWDHESRRIMIARSNALVPIDRVLYAFGAFLLLITCVHFIVSILSSAIMCRIYWCSGERTMTVIYLRDGGIDQRLSATGASTEGGVVLIEGKAALQPPAERTNPISLPTFENNTETSETRPPPP